MQISEQNGIKFRIKTPVYFDNHVEVGFGLERDIHWAEIDINRCNRNKEVPFREQIPKPDPKDIHYVQKLLDEPVLWDKYDIEDQIF